MKQALFILAIALYLVSLCACGDQKIQSKSKQGSATQQVVQEQMANVTGETTVPPTAIPEQQPASDETTPETSVPEPEQMQPAEALPDYEPAQASGEPDVDLTTLSSTMVYSEVYNMLYYDQESYYGKTVKANGIFAIYQMVVDGVTQPAPVAYACIIADATACCAEGMEFVLEGDYTYPDDYPELGAEITVIGEFQSYEENGMTWYHLVNARLA